MIDEKILIEKIKEHAKNVGINVSESAVKSGYLLAHEHIIDIVRLLSKHNRLKNRKGISSPPIKTNKVDVVYCKDCVHCDPANRHCDHVMGTMFPFSRKENDFCSYGQRKG